MTTQEFIEKAKEGGYEYKGDGYYTTNYESILLDKEAWEAVGRVEGWADFEILGQASKDIMAIRQTGDWITKANGLMPHLIKGGTMESYLETL